MQVAVVVVDVTAVWRVIAVLLQYSECDTAVDAQSVDRHKALVASFLLHDGELAVAKVLRRYPNQVAVSLSEVAAKHKHVTHTFQRCNLVLAQFSHLLLSEVVSIFLPNFKMIYVADFIGRERNLAGDIVRDVHLAVTRIQLHAILG